LQTPVRPAYDVLLAGLETTVIPYATGNQRCRLAIDRAEPVEALEPAQGEAW
jgi:hypothetical protein